MKPNIHPEYREVAFVDLSINKTFIISSSVATKETVEIDGQKASVLVSRYNGKVLRVIPNDELSRSMKLTREELLKLVK